MATSERRKGERVIFERGIPAHMMGIDGTWRRECTMEDISETGAKLTVEGSVEGLHLKEFFLLLSSTGLAYRRCELSWVNGDQIGVNFLKTGDKRKKAASARKRPTPERGAAAVVWPSCRTTMASSSMRSANRRDMIAALTTTVREISRNVRQAHQSHGPRRRSRRAHASPDRQHAEAAGARGRQRAARSCAGQARRGRRRTRPSSMCIICPTRSSITPRARTRPRVIISDERDQVLGTGGAVVKALPLLGDAPFFHVNADTMWIDGVRPNLARLAEAFDPARMDILLLMAPTASSIGYGGRGDYAMLADGALRKRREHEVVPFVYAGAAIMSPSLFADAPTGEFSLTRNVRLRQRAGAAVRPAAGRRVDACRNPRRGAGGGTGLSRQRGVVALVIPGRFDVPPRIRRCKCTLGRPLGIDRADLQYSENNPMHSDRKPAYPIGYAPGSAHAMMPPDPESGSPCAFSASQYPRRSCAPSSPLWSMADWSTASRPAPIRQGWRRRRCICRPCAPDAWRGKSFSTS